MKRKTITITGLFTVLSMAVFVIGAEAQNKTAKKQSMSCCPGYPMSRSAGTEKADASAKPQAMMQRCQVMMQTPIFIDSPCAVYGQAEVLELSEEQKKKLVEIENEARKKTLDTLTDKQKKKMGDIPKKPMAMAQMCQQMGSKMMPMMGGKGQEGSMMCPWMQTPPNDNDVQAKSSMQVTCPVMGGAINKELYTEYKGKKVYFCCPGCKPKFEANPEKYVSKLPQFSE